MDFSPFENRLKELGYSKIRSQPMTREYSLECNQAIAVRSSLGADKRTQNLSCYVSVLINIPHKVIYPYEQCHATATILDLYHEGLAEPGVLGAHSRWKISQEQSLMEAWEKYALPWLIDHRDIDNTIFDLQDQLIHGVRNFSGPRPPPPPQEHPGAFSWIFDLINFSSKPAQTEDAKPRRPPGNYKFIAYAYFWKNEREAAEQFLQEGLERENDRLNRSLIQAVLNDLENWPWKELNEQMNPSPGPK